MKVATFGLVALFAISGCDKIAEKIGQKAGEKAVEGATGGDVKVDTSNGGVTVTDKKTGTSTTSGDSVKLPSGWPSNVPAYPGARIASATVSGKNKTATMTTKDSPAQVADFYKKSGLRLESDVDLGAMRTMSFKNGNGTISIIMQSQGGETAITIAVVD